VKAADELQKKWMGLRGSLSVSARAWNAGPPFEWKPEPLPNHVQGLLGELDGFAAAPGGHRRKSWQSDSTRQRSVGAVKKLAEEDLPALNRR